MQNNPVIIDVVTCASNTKFEDAIKQAKICSCLGTKLVIPEDKFEKYTHPEDVYKDIEKATREHLERGESLVVCTMNEVAFRGVQVGYHNYMKDNPGSGAILCLTFCYMNNLEDKYSDHATVTIAPSGAFNLSQTNVPSEAVTGVFDTYTSALDALLDIK